MAKSITARQAAERLGLPHREVIRRIRRGDIAAKKWGWNWAVDEESVEAVKLTDWYQKSKYRSEEKIA